MRRDREARKVRNVLNHLRNMNTWQRLTVRQWLNEWYEYHKECEQEGEVNER